MCLINRVIYRSYGNGSDSQNNSRFSKNGKATTYNVMADENEQVYQPAGQAQHTQHAKQKDKEPMESNHQGIYPFTKDQYEEIPVY